MVSDLLRGFGVEPKAAIGYSLGESSALFAARGWPERDEMLRRIQNSPLFPDRARRPLRGRPPRLGLAEGEPADWLAGIVPHSAETVRAALAGRERVYLLIVNTPREVVVGGRRDDVLDLARTLGGRFFPCRWSARSTARSPSKSELRLSRDASAEDDPSAGRPILQRSPRRVATTSTARPRPTRSSPTPSRGSTSPRSSRKPMKMASGSSLRPARAVPAPE